MSRRLIPGALLAVALLTCGCNYVIGLGYLIGGPPSVEPDFDKMTNKSLTDEAVVVAVVCYAPVELKWNNSEIDHEIANYVAHRLHQHHVVVRKPSQVQAWVDEHPNWDQPSDIGKGVEVSHVVFIDLTKFSLYEEGASHLYRGRAEAIISVTAKQPTGEWNEIYVKELMSQYPLAIPRPVSQQGFGSFKREYLERLSDEIGRLFYQYYNGDDMGDII